MHVALWILQVVLALLYAASGTMKVFLFDEISGDVPSFGALPREAWAALGVLELACAVCLVVPSALRRMTSLTTLAAAALALESLVFVWAHVRYDEVGSIVMSATLGVLAAFVAYGRAVLRPIA